MPYLLSWNHSPSLTVTYTGETSDVEFLEAVLKEHGDYRFDTLRRVLHDFTDVTGCSYSNETLSEIDYHSIGAAFTNPNIRVAVVADHDDVLAMFEAFLDSRESTYPLRIFSSLTKARKWLEEAHGTAPNRDKGSDQNTGA